MMKPVALVRSSGIGAMPGLAAGLMPAGSRASAADSAARGYRSPAAWSDGSGRRCRSRRRRTSENSLSRSARARRRAPSVDVAHRGSMRTFTSAASRVAIQRSTSAISIGTNDDKFLVPGLGDQDYVFEPDADPVFFNPELRFDR